MKTFEATVKAITEKFLSDEATRTYEVDGKSYVAHFEEETASYDDGTTRHILNQTDWGFCYSEIEIPADALKLANLFTRSQLGICGCDLPQIAQRYYYAILRELND